MQWLHDFSTEKFIYSICWSLLLISYIWFQSKPIKREGKRHLLAIWNDCNGKKLPIFEQIKLCFGKVYLPMEPMFVRFKWKDCIKFSAMTAILCKFCSLNKRSLNWWNFHAHRHKTWQCITQFYVWMFLFHFICCAQRLVVISCCSLFVCFSCKFSVSQRRNCDCFIWSVHTLAYYISNKGKISFYLLSLN